MSVKEDLEVVKQNIKKACNKAKRDPREITLVAVSKTKPVSLMNEAMELGQDEFGENYVQEILSKYEEIGSSANIHMIGHLQRNKVKYIVDKVCMIHSVDSIRLAQAISKECVKRNVVMPILIEVNMAREESKWGFMQEEVIPAILDIAKLPNIKVKGLMTSAPNTTNPESNRGVFEDMRKLKVDIDNKNIDNIDMSILSMGMSNDYEVAIEHGATHIRVGTKIFGDRQYN